MAENTQGTVLILLGGRVTSTGSAYFSDVQLRKVLPAPPQPAENCGGATTPLIGDTEVTAIVIDVEEGGQDRPR